MLLDELLARAYLEEKAEEARRYRLVSEARRLAKQDGGSRVRRWRVEPDMEGAFQNLLGSLLSSQRDAPIESGATISRPGNQRANRCLPACCQRAA